MDMTNHLQRTYWPSVRAWQALSWVNRLQRIAHDLAGGKRRELSNELWIPLYGVLVDIGVKYETIVSDERNSDFNEVVQKSSKSSGLVLEVLESIGKLDKEVREACRALRAPLSRDELITVEYFRNNEAHVFQDAYRLSLGMVKSGILDAKLDRAEVDKIISTLYEKHVEDQDPFAAQDLFAIEVATRIAPMVDALVPLFEQIRGAALLLQNSLRSQLPFAPRE